MSPITRLGSYARTRQVFVGAAVVAAAALTVPTTASATSTVKRVNGLLSVIADQGEANAYFVRQVGNDVVVLETGGNTVTAGPGCTTTSSSRAVCASASSFNNIGINSGDLNDSIDVNVQFVNTYLNGDDGNDLLKAVGQSQADTFVGGPGTDTVSYAGVSFPVVGSLDGVANDGNFVVDWIQSDVEGVIGGNGNDTLTGQSSSLAAMSSLTGGPGNDTLSSAGGNTTMRGGDGTDTLNGGAGIDWLYGDAGIDTLDGKGNDDILDVNDGEGGDSAKCGTGTDYFARNAGDLNPDAPACESINTF